MEPLSVTILKNVASGLLAGSRNRPLGLCPRRSGVLWDGGDSVCRDSTKHVLIHSHFHLRRPKAAERVPCPDRSPGVAGAPWKGAALQTPSLGVSAGAWRAPRHAVPASLAHAARGVGARPRRQARARPRSEQRPAALTPPAGVGAPRPQGPSRSPPAQWRPCDQAGDRTALVLLGCRTRVLLVQMAP